MKRIVSAFSITLLLSLVSISPLRAQGTAQINGSVRDQSGAVLPGVEITATLRTLTFVPTAAMLAGDFTAVTLPACNAGRQISLRSPFANNRIDPAQFSKVALAAAKLLPSSSDPCG